MKCLVVSRLREDSCGVECGGDTIPGLLFADDKLKYIDCPTIYTTASAHLSQQKKCNGHWKE